MALRKLDLLIQEAEFTGIVGPSGSGKTTLLNIIGSLDKPSTGDATVLGKEIKSLSHKEAASLRNFNIGFIFQVFNLLPVYTVFENVEFALLLQKKSALERKKAVIKALEWVGLEDQADKRPDKLSGGESQRVAIARAMVKTPKIVLADEPTANLDPASTKIIEDIILNLKMMGIKIIFVTHNILQAKRIADEIIFLNEGKMVEHLNKQEFFSNSKSIEVQNYLNGIL